MSRLSDIWNLKISFIRDSLKNKANMESLKKIISLSQASQISGYTQDHLGYLIRQGDIKGVKKGRLWFTTEEEVKDYIFKKQVRNQKLALRGFFSRSRTKNIIIITIIFSSIIFFFFNKSQKTPNIERSEIKEATVSDGEAMKISE